MRILLTLLCLLVPTQAYALTTQLSNLDQFIGKTFYNQTNSTKRLLEAGYGPKMTFAKDYRYTQSFSADVAVGSPIGTFSRTGGATKPATYIDESGTIQTDIASNTARFTQGYYGTAGFVAQPGLLIEGASTNLLKNSYCSLGTDTATSWQIAEDDTNNDIPTLVDATDLIGITGAQAQRVQMTISDATFFSILIEASLAGTFTQNDYATVSFWLKGSTSGLTIQLTIQEQDVGATSGTTHKSSDIVSSLSATEWRRFTYSVQLTDADLNRARVFLSMGSLGAGDTLDLNVTGAQLEELPYASSFIPTTTAALTRNAEKLTYPITGNRTAATESMVVRVSPEYANNILLVDGYISDTDTKQRFIYYKDADNKIFLKPNHTDQAGTGTFDLINEAWSANAVHTLGTSFKATGNPNTACYFQGVADGTDDNDDYTPNAWGTNFYIGSDNGGTNVFFGTIQSVAFFSDTKSAADQARITGLLDGGK